MKYIFIPLILLLAAACTPKEKVKAHVSRISITPPIEMKYTLGGYGDRMNKPATGIHDSIYAKAIIFRKGEHKYAIVTLDILGLPVNLKPDLVERLKGTGLGMENVMLLPSHSHGSLEMEALNSRNQLNNPQIGIFQPELLSFLLGRLEQLIRNADRDYADIKAGTGSQLLEGLNRNRRNDTETDRELIITRIDFTDGSPMAVLVNWTAHPTFIGAEDMYVTAEWPGYLQSSLESSIGGNVTVMYYNGAEGDQSPVLDADGDHYRKAGIYGQTVAFRSLELYKKIRTASIKDFSSAYKVVRLPEQQAHPSFMKTGGTEYGLDEATVRMVLKMLGPEETGLGAFRLGDLLIAGVPGEMTAVLGLGVKKELGAGTARYVAIGGLANEWISYILSRDQYLSGEGYESSVSFYGPDLGTFISREVISNASVLTR